jgi:mevalonate pyrophosphate decarboxylase
MATKTDTAKKATPKKKATKAEPQAATAEKLSQITAAERVLADAGEPMTCGESVEAMTAKGLWSSPAGKTPAATLYASLLRLIRAKGDQAKFKKVARGRFTLA